MIDTFGVPEYYADKIGDVEDAGNGMIRVVRCIERRAILIPVFSLVTPVIAMLQEESRFREIANRVAGMDGVCRH
jgi:hypothetical protein